MGEDEMRSRAPEVKLGGESEIRKSCDLARPEEISQSHQRERTRTRVLIVAPDVMTGEFAVKTLNKKKFRFELKVSIGSASSALSDCGTFTPHIALISDELQDGPHDGFKVLRDMQRAHPNIAVVMLLKRSSADQVVEAFRFGARGIIYRSNSLKSLPKCIQTVKAGQLWIGNGDLEQIMTWLSRATSTRIVGADGAILLAKREQDVVRLVIDGFKNREIAHSLGITEHSVRNYLYRIFDKLGVSSRAELILYAFSKNGITLRSNGSNQSAEDDYSFPQGTPPAFLNRSRVAEK